MLTFAASAVLAVVPLVPVAADASAENGEKISQPGHYEGYSPVLYDGYKLVSLYIPMRDGTRIAIDLARPTRNVV